MSFLDMFKKGAKKIVDSDYHKKLYILKYLTMNQVHDIEKEYYGKELKFYFMDSNKIERSRASTRSELSEAISLDVPIGMILEKFPQLENKLK